MNDNLCIPVLLGTLRKERRSIHPARLICEEVQKRGVQSTLIDVKDVDLPLFEDYDHPKVKSFSEIIARADGLIIVSPEYIDLTFWNRTKEDVYVEVTQSF